jgi:hypothetical protein
MASIRRQITAASATVFIVLIGLRVYADVWKLLLSYLPVNESTHELRREPVRNDTLHDNDEDEDNELLFDEKDDDYEREIDLRKESLAELTRLVILTFDTCHRTHHGRRPKKQNSNGYISTTHVRPGGRRWQCIFRR